MARNATVRVTRRGLELDGDWDSVARDYRDYLKSIGRSQETIRTYAYAIGQFWRWCCDHETDPRTIESPIVRRWISERQEHVSAQRAHNELAALRHFVALCREMHWRDDDPTTNVRVKRGKAPPTAPLEDWEIEAMLRACTLERDRLILLVMAYTGMRIAEVAALEAQDVDWAHNSLLIRGKGDKVRRVFPAEDVMGRLHAFLGMFPEGPLWTSQKRQQQLSAHQIRKILYGIAERARVEHFHPHRLRAYLATKHMDQYGDIQALQAILGHESIETTARYSQTTRERRARDQMRAIRLVPITYPAAG